MREEDGPTYVPSKGWAGVRLGRDDPQVYELDPLRCPACGGQMRIIFFIEETKTIEGKSKS
jgi:hypothetical protein